MNNKSIAVAIATGRQIIRDEHAFFVNVGVDNSEHVPRIERIAESIRSILSQEGPLPPKRIRPSVISSISAGHCS